MARSPAPVTAASTPAGKSSIAPPAEVFFPELCLSKVVGTTCTCAHLSITKSAASTPWNGWVWVKFLSWPDSRILPITDRRPNRPTTIACRPTTSTQPHGSMLTILNPMPPEAEEVPGPRSAIYWPRPTTFQLASSRLVLAAQLLVSGFRGKTTGEM